MNYKEFPHKILLPNDTETISIIDEEVFNWLEDNISDYQTRWIYDGYEFMFKNEQDATLFALRWV